MALKLRLSRAGRKNLPFYHIVVAESRAARDGKFVEKVGTYDPRQPQGSDKRIVLNTERVKYWISKGALPSERVAIFLGKAGMIAMPKPANRPQKSQPKAKAQERVKAKEEKLKAAQEAAEAAKTAAAAPAPAPAEAVPAAEAPATEQPAG